MGIIVVSVDRENGNGNVQVGVFVINSGKARAEGYSVRERRDSRQIETRSLLVSSRFAFKRIAEQFHLNAGKEVMISRAEGQLML